MPAKKLPLNLHVVLESSIQEIRKSRAEARKLTFRTMHVVIVKLLPGLNDFGNYYDHRQQLLLVSKHKSSSRKYNSKTFSTVLYNWNLNDRYKLRACALLEQIVRRELLEGKNIKI